MSVAIAVLGLNISEFYELTPKELHLALAAKNKTTTALYEVQVKSLMETMRLHSFIAYQMAPNTKHTLKTPEDLYRFKWEGEKKAQTVEEMIAVMLNIKSRQERN